jgi:hypothetical protein
MKRRITLLLAVLTILTAISPAKAYAFTSSIPSAHFAESPTLVNPQTVVEDNRAQILRSYLEQYNSPLADHAETFIKEADANNLDWKWVAAISGVESYFGQMIPPNSYNGWGFGVYGSNVRNFASWDDGITVVSTSLRHEYMDGRGATDIYTIGSTYAADPRWAVKVQHFVDDIDQYSKRFDKPALSISL